MTINDLVAPPGPQAESLKTLAHVEFQLRVMGLLCAAAADGHTALTTPGTLHVWARYVTLNRSALRCDTCEAAALDVAECIETEVAPGTSVQQMRNQVFHGGPDPTDVDFEILQSIVTANAKK